VNKMAGVDNSSRVPHFLSPSQLSLKPSIYLRGLVRSVRAGVSAVDVWCVCVSPGVKS